MVDSISGTLEGHSWIVLENDSGEVAGAAYFTDVEDELSSRGERVLIIETSGVDGFEAPRLLPRTGP